MATGGRLRDNFRDVFVTPEAPLWAAVTSVFGQKVLVGVAQPVHKGNVGGTPTEGKGDRKSGGENRPRSGNPLGPRWTGAKPAICRHFKTGHFR